MPDRSVETTVTFDHAFTIGDATGVRPAGTYRVVIDEDEVRGPSFLAYRRVATLFHVPAIGSPGPEQVFAVDGAALDAAVRVDRKPVAAAASAA